MTRIKNGFWSDVELEDGFFLTDKEVAIVTEWLECYAEALEKAWKRSGSPSDGKTPKHVKVRSFAKRVQKLSEEKSETLLTGDERK